MERFDAVGVIKNQLDFDEAKLDDFMDGIEALRNKGTWTKDDIVKIYFGLLPEFAHKETGKYLDQRMCNIGPFLIFYFLEQRYFSFLLCWCLEQ